VFSGANYDVCDLIEQVGNFVKRVDIFYDEGNCVDEGNVVRCDDLDIGDF
jgi:hypothetical protein